MLDTSAYSAFGRGDQSVRGLFDDAELVQVPLIVCGELRAGFAAGGQAAANNTLLDTFLDQPFVEVLELTEKTTQLYADIFAVLKRKGKPIGTNDMWIAALCLEHDVPLATLDSDFKAVEGLKLTTL